MTHQSKWYRPEIEAVSLTYQLDPDLVEAIVRKESSGLTHAYRYEPDFFDRYLKDDPEYDGCNPRRFSASYGLMQIMYPTARDRGYTDPPEYLFVPLVGLKWGCYHLSRLFEVVKGDVDRALAAYNGGLGNSRKPFRPIISAYVDGVKHNLNDIREGK